MILTDLKRLEISVSTASELPLPPVSLGSLHADSDALKIKESFSELGKCSNLILEDVS